MRWSSCRFSGNMQSYNLNNKNCLSCMFFVSCDSILNKYSLYATYESHLFFFLRHGTSRLGPSLPAVGSPHPSARSECTSCIQCTRPNSTSRCRSQISCSYVQISRFGVIFPGDRLVKIRIDQFVRSFDATSQNSVHGTTIEIGECMSANKTKLCGRETIVLHPFDR